MILARDFLEWNSRVFPFFWGAYREGGGDGTRARYEVVPELRGDQQAEPVEMRNEDTDEDRVGGTGENTGDGTGEGEGEGTGSSDEAALGAS